MATIGVQYKDSGLGTGLAKALMDAVVGDPNQAANTAKLEAYLMGANLDRQRTQGLMEAEAAKAAREQAVFNYSEGAIDPMTDLAWDALERRRPAEPPVPVAPVEVDLGGSAGRLLEDDVAPVEVEPTVVPAADVAAMPMLPQPGGERVVSPMSPDIAGGLTTVLPEGPVPIEQDIVPIAPAAMPTQPLRQAPNVIGAPADLTAPAPSLTPPEEFDGGAVDNGDGTITTPDGRDITKAELRAMVAQAAHHPTDPQGALRALTGQFGLTYGDTPAELEKAMILLGEDPTKLPSDLGGEAGGAKQSDIKAMRQEVTKARENLAVIEPLYTSLETSLDRTDHVSDLDFVYGVATILDPGSVVREQDAVNIARSAGLSPEILGRINAVNGGAALDKATRLKLMALAKARIDGYRTQFNKTAADYVDRAKRAGFDPRDVVPSETLEELENPPAPPRPPPPATPPIGWTPETWGALTDAEKWEVIDELEGRTTP